MYRARGIKLPLYYFFQAHLFDWLHQTDTHTWLPKDRYQESVSNLEHGVMYMASWTSEIKRTFDSLRSLLGAHFPSYSFIDVGCGKGKVVAVWNMLCRKQLINQPVTGIDYHLGLIKIARENHQKLLGYPGHFFAEDATQTEFGKFGDHLIIYLYNPFDAVILEIMLYRLRDIPCIIIYNNPVHAQTLENHSWIVLAQHNGFHPNLHTIIYTNHELSDHSKN